MCELIDPPGPGVSVVVLRAVDVEALVVPAPVEAPLAGTAVNAQLVALVDVCGRTRGMRQRTTCNQLLRGNRERTRKYIFSGTQKHNGELDGTTKLFWFQDDNSDSWCDISGGFGP